MNIAKVIELRQKIETKLGECVQLIEPLLDRGNNEDPLYKPYIKLIFIKEVLCNNLFKSIVICDEQNLDEFNSLQSLVQLISLNFTYLDSIEKTFVKVIDMDDFVKMEHTPFEDKPEASNYYTFENNVLTEWSGEEYKQMIPSFRTELTISHKNDIAFVAVSIWVDPLQGRGWMWQYQFIDNSWRLVKQLDQVHGEWNVSERRFLWMA